MVPGTMPLVRVQSSRGHHVWPACVLMFHGALDRNVKVAQSRLMESRLKAAGKPVTLVVQDKLDHYLDDSVVRRDMLLQSASFLDTAFKAGK